MSLPNLSLLNFSALDAGEEGEKLEGAQEQFNRVRFGRITASKMHQLLTCANKPDVLPAGAKTYLDKKITQRLTEYEHEGDGYKSKSMQWGLDHEVEAVERFTEETGLPVRAYGADQESLIKGDYLSCTPDGLIETQSGAETKCLNSENHLKFLEISTAEEVKKVFPNHYWQCLASCFITDRKDWNLISYDPRFKKRSNQIVIIPISPKDRSDDFEFMQARIKLSIDYVKNKMEIHG